MVKKDDSIYAPSAETFDARLDGDENRGPLLLVVAIAVLLAFAAVIYTAYHQGLRKGGRAAAPHVTAASGPQKVRPDERHDKPTPNLGNKAYEPLDDVAAAPATPVKTAPLPEKPLPRPLASETPKQVKPKPTPAPVQPRPKPRSRPSPKAATSGTFFVQIASFRSQDQAKSAWSALQGSLPALLKGRSADVQRADLGAKGVYYRLRAASFADRAAASAFCARLNKKGHTCLVVSH